MFALLLSLAIGRLIAQHSEPIFTELKSLEIIYQPSNLKRTSDESFHFLALCICRHLYLYLWAGEKVTTGQGLKGKLRQLFSTKLQKAPTYCQQLGSENSFMRRTQIAKQHLRSENVRIFPISYLREISNLCSF